MSDLDHKFFADVYDAEDSLWVAVIQPCFVGAQDRITGELLDIGCGSGDHAR